MKYRAAVPYAYENSVLANSGYIRLSAERAGGPSSAVCCVTFFLPQPGVEGRREGRRVHSSSRAQSSSTHVAATRPTIDLYLLLLDRASHGFETLLIRRYITGLPTSQVPRYIHTALQPLSVVSRFESPVSRLKAGRVACTALRFCGRLSNVPAYLSHARPSNSSSPLLFCCKHTRARCSLQHNNSLLLCEVHYPEDRIFHYNIDTPQLAFNIFAAHYPFSRDILITRQRH